MKLKDYCISLSSKIYVTNTCLEIQIPTAHDAMNRLAPCRSLEIGQDVVQRLLGLLQTLHVVVLGPLTTPFPSNSIKVDALGDGAHGTHGCRLLEGHAANEMARCDSEREHDMVV
jgi:hypothetical protein